MKAKKYRNLTLSFGCLFLGAYLLEDYLFTRLWFFSFIPLFIFGLLFLIYFILSTIQGNRKGIIIGIIIIGIVCAYELVDSELFKGEKVLEASLLDDLSAIHLTLREGNKFEMVSSTIFTQQTFKGTFQINDNKIIFNDRPYDNEFIPDTLTIIGDKIILRFDEEGNPKTDFANYFEIQKNELKNAP